MKIRKLKKNEIEKVASLCEREMRVFLGQVNESISVEKYEKRILNDYDLHEMYVLVEDTNIKGFIWFSVDNNEINLEEIFTGDKNIGLGRLLMNYILDYAKNNNKLKINLSVHVGNNNAKEFFKKLGFTERTIEMSLEI